jgi:phosphoribosylamine--glycine ligase
MRVLLIMDAGDGLLDLGLRAQAGGHQVKAYIRKYDTKTRPVGKGLVELVNDWRNFIQWCDLCILENNGFSMQEFGRWRLRGVPIIGGDERSAAWELDRKKGMEVFHQAGIEVPEYREFTAYDDAIRYVERRGEPLYSKPCSDTADKSLSAKTGIPEDPTWQLRKWKKKHGRPPCPFLLQDPVEGVEIGVGAWFGPAGFSAGWEENWEHKRMCSGDVGENTGEMGTVSRIVRRSKLADRILAPLEDHLYEIGFVGNVDVNCIVADGDPWPLEFTMRLGWPAFMLETDLFACDPVEFLHALASGESIKNAHRYDEVAVGVVLAIPPYPRPPRDYTELIGVPLYGPNGTDGFHGAEVMAGEETLFESAGHYLGVQVGTGARVTEAARQAYRGLKKISLPGSPFWRNDIGGRLRKDLPALQRHNFAADLEF